MKLYLLKRKGFIKLALRHGVDLVPSFSFNEQLIFKQLSPEKGKMYLKFIIITFEYVFNNNTAADNKYNGYVVSFRIVCTKNSRCH